VLHAVALALSIALALQGCSIIGGEESGAESSGSLSQDETLYLALEQMAQGSEANHKYSKAEEQYGRLVQSSPEEPAFILGLARNTRYAGHPRESVRILRRSMAEGHLEETLDVRLEMARALLASGVSADAAAQVADLRNRAPNDARVQALVGILADREGRHGEAQAAYRAAMVLDPYDLRSANNLALSLALTGNLAEAIGIQMDVASNPKATLPMRQNLALLYALAGRMDMAEQVTRAILPEEQADRVVADLSRIQGQPHILTPSLQP